MPESVQPEAIEQDPGIMNVRCVCPIAGFVMDGESVSLGPNLDIVRVRDDEMQWIMQQPWMRSPGARCTFAFVYLCSLPAGEPGSTACYEAQTPIDEACTVLHLLKAGFLNYTFVFARELKHDGSMGSGSYAVATNCRPTYGEPQYVFQQKDISGLSELLSLYQRPQTIDSALQLAIRRLDFTYDRTRPGDRLMDAVIGLEALLLGQANGELSYRFSLRGAWLLGESAAQRAVIHAHLKKAYDLRSRLVHGSEVEQKEVLFCLPDYVATYSFPTFVCEVEDLLRRIIRKLLRIGGGKSTEDALAHVDEAMVRGELTGFV